MKKRKIFGIVAMVLIVLSTMIPATYGMPLKAKTINQNINNSQISNEINWDKIYTILELHKDDVEEINQYVNDYIAKSGYITWNFVLPDELQSKFDAILGKIGIEPQRPEVLERIMEQPVNFKIISTLMQRMNKYPSFFKLYGITNKLIFDRNSLGGGYALTFETVPGGCTCEVFGVGTKTSTNENGGEWGHCTFYDLEEGTYDWEVRKSGYISESGSCYLDSDTKIIAELKEEGGDGITKLDWKVHKVEIFWITLILGIEVNLWMSHSYIVDNLNPGTGLGIIGITLLLVALGFKTLGIAWIFAAWLLTSGINDINNADHGRGVYVEFSIGLGPGWPPKFSPQ